MDSWGQYIYYLAGDFVKNNKGYFEFATETTSSFVEVYFEDDVINVAKSDSNIEQEIANQHILKDQDIKNLTVEECVALAIKNERVFDHNVIYGSLNSFVKDNAGLARLIINQSLKDTNTVSLIYEEFREPQNDDELVRYTKIIVKSKKSNQSIEKLLERLLDLISTYSNMPYVYVTGARR